MTDTFRLAVNYSRTDLRKDPQPGNFSSECLLLHGGCTQLCDRALKVLLPQIILKLHSLTQ